MLFLTDRLSHRGGADQHLLQMVASAGELTDRVTLACHRHDDDVALPPGTEMFRLRALGSGIDSGSGWGRLDELLDEAEIVHVQNVMNPRVLRRAVATRRSVVTVQDHRVFCPGMGRTLPGGERCRGTMEDEKCSVCLPDLDYRRRLLELTRARADALRGARLLVLSPYMAEELVEAGLPGATVLPPWVELGPPRREAGDGFLLAGRLVAHKGVLEAWRGWRTADTDLPLRVAGEGPLEAELTGTQRLGWLDCETLRRELRRARALLFPAFWQEPFGLLGIEALAEGTPVVVPTAGGTDDWTHAGCLRLPANHPSHFRKAIERLDRDPELALHLGRAGQEAIAHRFTRPHLEPHLHQIWHETRTGPRTR